MKQFMAVCICAWWVLSALFGACSSAGTGREISRVDSLNRLAYAYRYKDLEACRRYASEAWQLSGARSDAAAEALCHLGFVAFMQMDLVEAGRCFAQVEQLTGNELERLVADVGRMAICQRKAQNKEFYDYRNRALKRLKRIEEEAHLFPSPHQQQRLCFARSEFFRVSAAYYDRLQQREDAWQALRQMHRQPGLNADTAQLLYYHYIKGTAQLCDGSTADERMLEAFDQLLGVWRLATRYGYRYFEGNAWQGMAHCLLAPGGYDLLLRHRQAALLQLGWPLDSLLPLRMGQQALQVFTHYRAPYSRAGAYLAVGSYLNRHGAYEEAIDSLTAALDQVNHLRGMAPERFARICEQFSVSYAGLGQKTESDVHRNMYLDMLDDTRQDKELESRYRALEQQSHQLNVLMTAVLIGWVGVALLFVWFSRWSRQRSRRQLQRLQGLLEGCRQLTASLPAQAQTQEEVMQAMEEALRPTVKQLFGTDDFSLHEGRLEVHRRLSREEQAMVGVFQPYIRWTLDNGLASVSLGDERKRQEKQRYVYERRIADNKRQNVVRKACLTLVNGMHPYIDRLLHEVRRLRQAEPSSSALGAAESSSALEAAESSSAGNGTAVSPSALGAAESSSAGNGTAVSPSALGAEESCTYLEELTDTLNEHYDLLALWIQMKQGALSMNIETFALDELFDLMRRGSRSFELKGQTLEVKPAPVTVKADKALTLFMLNTLADNARKFTPRGGHVGISAHTADGYVEIAVTDTGCGLSAADVARLNSEKVYDAGTIGRDTAGNDGEWLRRKGSGFGLMNCKGIMEKYRKTNAVFQVCRFGVESTPHRGSRFYFRLPLGVRRTVLLLALLWQVVTGYSAYHSSAVSAVSPSISDTASSAGVSAPSVSDTASSAVVSAPSVSDTASSAGVSAPSVSDTAASAGAVSPSASDTAASAGAVSPSVSDTAPSAGVSAVSASPDPFEELLDSASLYADEAYYANIDGDYEWALVYIDSAMQCLNRHYHRYAAGAAQPSMTLTGQPGEPPAELAWWKEGFPSDYHVVLDIRNEAAVAYLALKQWVPYSYNNDAYTTLYKLLGEDRSLEGYCRQLERSTGNKRVGMILGILLPVALLLGYALLYIRKRLQHRWNLEQVLHINSRMLAVVQPAVSQQRMADTAFTGLQDLLEVEGIGLALFSEEEGRLEIAFSEAGAAGSAAVRREADSLIDSTLLERCCRENRTLHEAGRLVFPLRAEGSGENGCIGALLVNLRAGAYRETDRLLLELVAGYVSVLAYNAVVKLATQSRDVEAAADETRRASWEASQLYVQNQVLDNCLSAIKHETVYYPHKIKQLIGRLHAAPLQSADGADTLLAIEELGVYYKDLLTLLSRCASRQLQEVTFRRTAVQVPLLLQGVERYFRKRTAARRTDLTLTLHSLPVAMWGDAYLLQFLLQCLVDEALSVPAAGQLCVGAQLEDGRVQVYFTDPRRTCTQEELNQLFYPSRKRMWVDDSGTLHGMEYLLCKQIIRDHEDCLGQRGCGMNARPAPEGGYTVYFSLPLTELDINRKES